MKCGGGHEIPSGSRFCPECGKVVDTEAVQPRPESRRTGKKNQRVLLVVALGSSLAVAALAMVLAIRPGHGETRTLTVSFTTVWGEPEAGCNLEDNVLTAQHMRGTRVLLSDAAGSVVGAGTLDPNGEKGSVQFRNRTGPLEACLWSVTIDDVPTSSAYTVDIETPQDGNESFTYSSAELEDLAWKVVLARG
jgi:hypothetical protein